MKVELEMKDEVQEMARIKEEAYQALSIKKIQCQGLASSLSTWQPSMVSLRRNKDSSMNKKVRT